jgi:hypothetical protein
MGLLRPAADRGAWLFHVKQVPGRRGRPEAPAIRPRATTADIARGTDTGLQHGRDDTDYSPNSDDVHAGAPSRTGDERLAWKPA